jgi:AcrR family transcriptional regulator
MNAASRRLEATRSAILDAAAELFQERQGDGFSIQDVATRAGLTHRTVYRYFPSRQALMGAAVQRLLPEIATDPFRDVTTVGQWIDASGPYMAGIESQFAVVRTILSAALASEDLRVFGERLHGGDRRRWEMFRRQFVHVPEADARRAYSMLRHLTSSASYVFLRLRSGMSPEETMASIREAATQVVEQIAGRDCAAAMVGSRQ